MEPAHSCSEFGAQLASPRWLLVSCLLLCLNQNNPRLLPFTAGTTQFALEHLSMESSGVASGHHSSAGSSCPLTQPVGALAESLTFTSSWAEICLCSPCGHQFSVQRLPGSWEPTPLLLLFLMLIYSSIWTPNLRGCFSAVHYSTVFLKVCIVNVTCFFFFNPCNIVNHFYLAFLLFYFPILQKGI